MANIAYVVRTLSLLGGSETVVCNLVQFDNQNSNRITLFILYSSDSNLERTIIKSLKEAGVDVCIIEERNEPLEGLNPFNLSQRIKWICKLGSKFREREIDLCLSVGAAPFGAIAAVIAGIPIRIEMLAGATDLFEQITGKSKNKYRIKLIYGLLTGFTDVYVVPSHSLKNWAIRQARIPSDRIVVIPNGIDASRFEGIDIDAGNIRAMLNIGDDAYVVVTVGRLVIEKDHKVLIEAAVDLVKEYEELLILIVGDGYKGDDLREYAKMKGVEDKVQFLGSRTDVPEILKCSNVYVQTSIYESFCMSVLEALLSKLPVVATNVGGISEIIEDKKHGILFEPGNKSQLVSAIRYLKENPQYAKDMAYMGYQHAVREYSIDSVTSEYNKLFESLIRRKRET